MTLTEPFTRSQLLGPNSRNLEGVAYILSCVEKDISENRLDGPSLDRQVKSSIGYILGQFLDNVNSETDIKAVQESNILLIEYRLRRINPNVRFYYLRTATQQIYKLWLNQNIEDLSLIRRLSEDLKSRKSLNLESYKPAY